MKRTLWLLTLLAPLLALASVGKVALLEGAASRTPDGGAKAALKVGDAVELGDTLSVDAKGNMKLSLTDESELALGGGSVLKIEEADFKDLDNRKFAGFLSVGKIWAHVKKAVGGGKFEVKTERAVAGVRGTIFRVDAEMLVKATKKSPRTVVMVHQGKVAVEAKNVKVAQLMPPAAAKAGERKQVEGPKQVSKDEYEAVVSQMMEAGSMVTIGGDGDIWEAAQLAQRKADAFDNWAKKNVTP
jgi:hypothetical protein